jgi:hypothetical protein
MYDQMYGTVDIQVGESYCTRTPVKPIHLFAIDSSESCTLEAGLRAVRDAAAALKVKFEDVPVKPCVGFFVFDAIMRFFRVSNDEVTLEVVADTKDSPFSGLPAVSFCHPVDEEGLSKLDIIINSVKGLIEKSPPPRSSSRLSAGGAGERRGVHGEAKRFQYNAKTAPSTPHPLLTCTLTPYYSSQRSPLYTMRWR